METSQYASATRRVQPSAIRELFSLLSRPDVISLAGGFPSAAALDLNGLRGATERALISSLSTAFQYCNSEGYGPLRDLIAQRAKAKGIKLDASDLLITTGSQQAIDLITRVLVNPGDRVAVEAPTYLGALQTFQFQGADVLPVPTDHEGVRVEELEALVVRHRPKLLYLIPNFANPTGYVMSLRRRKQVLSLAKTHRFFIVEDDAYGELYFEEPPPPSLFALANEEERQWVVHLASFSKILAPGLRLAWLSAPAELLRHVVVAKQLGDTHAPTLSQLAAFHYLNAGSLEPALSRLRRFYQNQARAMQRAIKTELSGTPFNARPAEGGMFYWADLPFVDTTAMLRNAIEEHGVAYVPGAAFYVGQPERTRLRLSFASASVEQIGEGIRRLARCIRWERVEASNQITRAEQLP
ncbi:GntR family transcriptional regulator [Caballeronia mineralivorans PML1(12)]|uniref:GntR family transcriptional regulator n=1 Tax=Caballeronia mineralivorans PML1(12) TaxID=908627 RepID=A0A0J1D337_9BURK|nr:GntR family transcriptional regulator [Caballeronia mineralivorans PML1(12)]